MSTGLNNFTLDDDEEGQVELSQPASVPTAANASSPAAAAEAASPSPTPAPQQPQQVSTSSGRESPAIALNAFAHPPANSSMLQRSDTSLARSAAAEISSKKAIETAQQIRSLTPTTSILTVKFIGPPGEAVDPELGLKSLAHAIQLLHENCDRIEEAEATLQALMRHHARLVAGGRLLEQQVVLDVLRGGPRSLGYDAHGRPLAALVMFRCCLRWSAFSTDPQACSVLEHFTALLAHATDEDVIAARYHQHHASAGDLEQQQQQGEGEGELLGAEVEGGGGRSGVCGAAPGGATGEMAYWLSVTSTLLAMVDPHLPLAATATSGAAPNGRHAPGAPAHPTPLAAVAGDARASVARAASAAAAKVTELKEKMNNTFSGMSLFSKGLLAKKRANSGAGALPPLPPPQDAAGAAAPAAATPAGEEAHGAGGGLTVQRQPSGSHTPVAGQESGVVVGSASSTQAGEGVQQQPHQQQQQQGAVHPGQAFRQHLDLAVQKTYGQVRDSLKRSVSAVLQDCMQVQGQLQGGPGSPLSPRVELHGGEGREGAAEEEGRSAEEEAAEAAAATAVAAQEALQQQLAPWRELVAVLAEHLALLRAAHVPRIIIKCLFKQTLSFVDVQLFNQLLLRPECCCTSNARYLVSGLQLINGWLAGPQGAGHGSGHAHAHAVPLEPGAVGGDRAQQGGGEQGAAATPTPGEDLGVLAVELRHIRQAAQLLALVNKGALRLDDITSLCPDLNVQQLYRLATTFWDDTPEPPAHPHPPPPPSGPHSARPSISSAPDAPDDAPAALAPTPALVQDPDQDQQQHQQAESDEHPEDELPVSPSALSASAPSASVVSPSAGPASPSLRSGSVVSASAASAVSRNVSGEVLEEMKRRHAVANNGGLIVTFLLDEDPTQLIAPGGRVSRQLLRLVNEPLLHLPLEELPPPLSGPDCPPEVFGYLLEGEAAVAGGGGEAAGVVVVGAGGRVA